VLLLCLTSTFNLSDLGGPTKSIKTPARIAIRVTEVRNPSHHEKVTAHGGGGDYIDI